MKEFTVKFHLADSEYLTALRLVCGACAHNLDLDALEDFKVCVTESAIILKNCGFDTVTAVFSGEDKVECTVSGEGGSPEEGDNEFSLALISALVEECSIERRGGIIERVTLKL